MTTQPAPVLRSMRRPPDEPAPFHRTCGRLCRDDPDARLHARRPRQLRRDRAADDRALRRYTVTWVPTSTTRPVGIWKKSVASLAVLASEMKSLSCQRGMPDCAAALIERRDRKNDVAMMSNLKPSLRRIARPRGMFGVSM